MKKHGVKKLFLSKETLRHLKEGDLKLAEGGLAAGNPPAQQYYSQQDSVNVCCA